MEQVHLGTESGKPTTKVKALLGPLTTRDTIVVVGAVLVFVGSLVPIPWTKAISVNMWIFPGLPFHLLISLVLPLGVGVAFAWRRFTKRTRVRVGSLSLDQFGSIVSLISAAYFFNSYVATMSPAYLLGLVGAIAMICGTTLARYFGAFRGDFVPGDDSVITADVRPVAVAAAKATAAFSTDSAEGFGASSNPGSGPAEPVVPMGSGTSQPKPSAEEKSAHAVAADEASPAAAALFGAGAGAGAAATVASGAAAAEAKTGSAVDPVVDESSAVNAASEEPAETPAPEETSANAPLATGREQEAPESTEAVAESLADNKSTPADESTTVGEAAFGLADESPALGETEPEPAAESKPVVPENTESAESVLPEISLVHPEGEPEPDPVPTGLVSTSTSASAPATSAVPVSEAPQNATAALSRAELAEQMTAAAASQRAQDDEPFGARSDAVVAEPESSSFWFALNQPRPVYDPKSGATITTLQPGVWILCLEDRGTDYLVNLEGDRQGVLRELDNLQFPEN